MVRTDLVSGIFLLAFSLALLVFIIPSQIALSSDTTLSPRLMPQICAWGLLVLSAVMTINALRDRSALKHWRNPFGTSEITASLMVVATLVVCIALFIYTGPLLPAIVIVVVPMFFMGERNLLVLVLMPAILVALAYVLIYVVLKTAFL